MSRNIEDTNSVVMEDGLNTQKAVSFGSTLAVTGVSTLASLVLTSTLVLSGALTGTTGYFSGVLQAPGTVSTSKVFAYGSSVVQIGQGSNTVSSVGISYGIPGADLNLSATTSGLSATSNLVNVGGIQFVGQDTGTSSCLVVVGGAISLRQSACP